MGITDGSGEDNNFDEANFSPFEFSLVLLVDPVLSTEGRVFLLEAFAGTVDTTGDFSDDCIPELEEFAITVETTGGFSDD
jgi:hypothetical protein